MLPFQGMLELTRIHFCKVVASVWVGWEWAQYLLSEHLHLPNRTSGQACGLRGFLVSSHSQDSYFHSLYHQVPSELFQHDGWLNYKKPVHSSNVTTQIPVC